jgi:uncharacterized protein YecE (DUF72 family)
VSQFRHIRIGTSGWTYRGWRGDFYPPKLPARQWLGWYSVQFSTAEINGSFYGTPSLDAVGAWRDQTPDDFVFAWKASKFITHWKRLSRKCRNSLELMETRLTALEPKVGPILFQLPPQFRPDVDRLAAFIKLLNPQRKYVFEFREPHWYQPEILDCLRAHRIALCLSDHRDAPAPWLATADHVYIRGHGPTGQYRGRYSQPTLQRWARQMRTWQRNGKHIYCYFDNDQKTAAPKDAQRLVQLLSPKAKARRRKTATA